MNKDKIILSCIIGFGVVFTITQLISFNNLYNPNKVAKKTRPKIVFFGDSITQHGFNNDISGWVSSCANWWSRRVDVINRGYSGYNSRWGNIIVEDAVINEKPDFLFVFFGANDSVDEKVVQHVPLDEYYNNLKNIVTKVKKVYSQIPIVLITPPPVFEETLIKNNEIKGKHVLRDRECSRTIKYVNQVLRLGGEMNIPVVNAFEALGGFSPEREESLSDGLHLSQKGNNLLFEEIKKTVTSNFNHFVPEMMKFDFPEWSKVDRDDPVSSFKNY